MCKKSIDIIGVKKDTSCGLCGRYTFCNDPEALRRKAEAIAATPYIPPIQRQRLADEPFTASTRQRTHTR